MMKIQIDAEAVIANPHPEWAEWIKEEIQDVLRSYNGHAVSVKLTEQHD